MSLFIAAALLSGFVVNVAIGSTSASAPLGAVPEMVLLLSAAVFFVIEVLRREARAAAQTNEHI